MVIGAGEGVPEKRVYNRIYFWYILRRDTLRPTFTIDYHKPVPVFHPDAPRMALAEHSFL